MRKTVKLYRNNVNELNIQSYSLNHRVWILSDHGLFKNIEVGCYAKMYRHIRTRASSTVDLQVCFVAKLQSSAHTEVIDKSRGLLLVGAANLCQCSSNLNLTGNPNRESSEIIHHAESH